ncbi:MAG: hypothetical protein JW940_04155 [Polyangiaceae bacterium]|nr:hypothetical protein [Polyangiaceae bacterium]
MQLPGESTLRAIVQRYARLVETLGAEVGTRPMVLPTNDFFPDIVAADEQGMQRLVDRLRSHAGMQDVPVRVQVLEEEGTTGAGGCCGGACSGSAESKHRDETHGGSGGSCGGSCSGSSDKEELVRLVEEDGGWRIVLRSTELGHEVALTTHLARTLARVFLLETLLEGQSIDPPVEVTTDLAAVALGFGTLMLQGSYIYHKSCCGPSVAKATALGCADLAVAFSLFVAQGGHSSRSAARHLDATQRALLQEAQSWIDSNPRIVTLLKERPRALVSGSFSMSETRPWLARVFGRRRTRDDDLTGDDVLAELEALAEKARPAARPKQASRDSKHDELRALVDEALNAPAAADEH